MIKILEIKPISEERGVNYADCLVRYPNGREVWQTMKESGIKYNQWLWSVRDRLTTDEITQLERIVFQMRMDAVNEAKDED